jgi:hypothetical protein
MLSKVSDAVLGTRAGAHAHVPLGRHLRGKTGRGLTAGKRDKNVISLIVHGREYGGVEALVLAFHQTP